MGIFDTFSNALTGKAAVADSRIDRVDQAKVIWYQWAKELPTNDKNAFSFGGLKVGVPDLAMPDTSLAACRAYDISNHIENLSYSKTLDSAAGSFSFTLHNSFDWVRFMKAGQWICIYLYENPLFKYNHIG